MGWNFILNNKLKSGRKSWKFLFLTTIYKSWRKFPTSCFKDKFKTQRHRSFILSLQIQGQKDSWTFFSTHTNSAPNRRPPHWWHWTVVNERQWKSAISRFSLRSADWREKSTEFDIINLKHSRERASSMYKLMVV